ncbi:MAG: carboxypeptidase regulatory-like domain-containing protein, partial [Terriglobia bacterium]
MNNQKLVWLFTAVMLLALVGCSKKEETTETPTENPATPAATPIDQATVGEVDGKISFDGAKPKQQRIMMDQDPVCVQKHAGAVFAEDGEVSGNGTLPNAFVYVKSGAEKYTFAPPPDPVVLDQDGCMYKPHVLGIMVGQTLKIVSSDATTHNIHPMPKDNREWNMSQAPGAAPIEQKFARPEVMVPVKCNQHPWMRAWIGVTSNPFYAVSGSDGTFTIKGLPPGNYTIEAWTATFGTQDQTVTVGAKETKTVDFKFK